jgi:hypothetical protein
MAKPNVIIRRAPEYDPAADVEPQTGCSGLT